MSNPSTISITGATGFIGAHLVRYFAKSGYQVEAIGRQKKPPPKLLQYASYLQADIADHVPELKGDIVIHTAALASDSAMWNDFFRTNVEGTRKVYEAAKNCRLFLHLSSASVYPIFEKPLKETAANHTHFSSNYGKSKYISEQVLKAYPDTKKRFILRPRAVYGPQDRVLLPRILNLVKAKRIMAPGDLNIQISMTHIDNLIAAIEASIRFAEQENFSKKDTTIWNITDERIYTLRRVVESLLHGIYKKELPYLSLPISPLKFLAKGLHQFGVATNFTPQSLDYVTHSTILDIEKIKEDVGYQARTDFYQALPGLLNWVERVGVEQVKKGNKNLPWMEIC